MRRLQRLQALQEQERVERAERRAEVAQALDARLHDVGEVAEGLVEAHAVVAGARLGQLREACPRPRGTCPLSTMHAADGGAVAADELGGRVDDDVGAMLDRPAQVGRGEGVVDDQRDAGLVGDLGDGRDVEHVDARVADRLAVEHAWSCGVIALAEVLGVVRVDEDGVDAEAAQA